VEFPSVTPNFTPSFLPVYRKGGGGEGGGGRRRVEDLLFFSTSSSIPPHLFLEEGIGEKEERNGYRTLISLYLLPPSFILRKRGKEGREGEGRKREEKSTVHRFHLSYHFQSLFFEGEGREKKGGDERASPSLNYLLSISSRREGGEKKRGRRKKGKKGRTSRSSRSF